MKQVYFSLLFLASFLHPILSYGQDVYIPEPGEGFSFNTSVLMVVGVTEGFTPALMANSQEIQFMREHHIGLTHFGVAFGLGYSGHFYHGNIHIHVDEDGTQSVRDLTGQDYKSNRFATEYLDGSLELRYRSKVNKKGRYNRLYVGGVLGYKVDAYSYQKAESYRVKFYNVDGFNTLRYGLYAKVGRGQVNLFYFYGLSQIVTSGPMLPEWSNATSQNLGVSITL